MSLLVISSFDYLEGNKSNIYRATSKTRFKWVYVFCQQNFSKRAEAYAVFSKYGSRENFIRIKPTIQFSRFHSLVNWLKTLSPELFIPYQILIWITLFHLQYWIFRGVVIFFLSKRLLETKRSTECDCYCVLGHTNAFVRTIFFKLTGTHQDKDWICRKIWKNSFW